MNDKPPSDRPNLLTYIIVLIVVAIVVIVVLALLGPSVGNVFSGSGNNL
ncbi:MAG: pilus assembly protein [Anaerolineae bacterium]|nr:pilus assembly protein [Anaerolineae bacterium]